MLTLVPVDTTVRIAGWKHITCGACDMVDAISRASQAIDMDPHELVIIANAIRKGDITADDIVTALRLRIGRTLAGQLMADVQRNAKGIGNG